MKFLLKTALSAFVALGMMATANAQDDESQVQDPMVEEELPVEEEDTGAYGEEPQQPPAEELGHDRPMPSGEMRTEEETEVVPVIPVVPVDPDAVDEEERTGVITAPVEEEVEEEDRRPMFGLGVSAGAGVTGFANDNANDIIDPGVDYTARLHVGGNSPIGLEAGYVGSAQNIDTTGLDNSAVLISNGVEGALRLNLSTGVVQPYVIGGLAWRRYDITNEDFNTSSVNDEDDILEVPVGAGLAWRYGGALVDGRANYRFASQEDLIPGVNNDDLGLDTWSFTLRAGWEF